MASPRSDRLTRISARRLLAALVAVGLGGALWWFSGQDPAAWRESAEAVFSSAESLREFVLGFGPWAPAVFFVIQVAQVVLAPIPGNVTAVAGAMIFG